MRDLFLARGSPCRDWEFVELLTQDSACGSVLG